MYTHLSYDETELLSLSSQGEEQAFIRLLQMHKHKLYSFLHTLTGFEPLTENLVQQLVLALWKKREALVQVEEFDHYLFEEMCHILLPGLKKAPTHDTGVEQAAIDQLAATCFQQECTAAERDQLHEYLQAPAYAHAMQHALLPLWNNYTATTFIPDNLWQNITALIPDEENPLARKPVKGKTGLFGLFGKR